MKQRTQDSLASFEGSGERERERESVAMMHSFIRVANHVLDNGGFVSCEWPRYSSGWMSESLASWTSQRQLGVLSGSKQKATSPPENPADL